MSQEPVEVLELELYTESRVVVCEVCCPSGLRLLDLLNEPTLSAGKSVPDEFLEVADLRSRAHDDVPLSFKSYVRKGAIRFAAVTDANTGRGAGAHGALNLYPFARKSHVTVHV